ncbi:MAG: DUF5110 domain-containing protein [Phycisphaerales bacterium]|nr:MAG: DUF5110 domain-containing protein [Phycisphaerales bacterium]
MKRRTCFEIVAVFLLMLTPKQVSQAAQITSDSGPGQLDIRSAAAHSIRITLKPLTFEDEFPFTPALSDRSYPEPAISLRQFDKPVKKKVGSLWVEVRPDPLRITVTNERQQPIQEIIFEDDCSITFRVGDQPILGMGEGGPVPKGNWRNEPIEFDRRGRLHTMRPRWQANAYGSRNPVALMIGTDGWGLFIATPWGQIDLRDSQRGRFTPWQPPAKPKEDPQADRRQRQRQHSQYVTQVQGKPPVDSITAGVFDLFVFDAHDPADIMKAVSVISGPAVLPPKWALGYMQSHRTLQDQDQMIDIVKAFRKKEIPLDSVVYLGTGFCPRGWNTQQPSFAFNLEVFKSAPSEVIRELHDLSVKVAVHIVPWSRDRLPTLRGTIPPQSDEPLDDSHILDYWKQHTDLVRAGIDAWWPDEGDWFNLFERMKRHQLYYQGPLSTQPNVRPWSLHRNGHLGIARWGGWVWSGDTNSAWKTLEGQIAVGINHSLSLSPFWGSDIGGFFPNEELTGELYVRWFQFGAFCPSFRSHGRTWWMRLPWGWGLTEMGPLESNENPVISELNNPAIEPICRQYAQLRYQLMPYTYTLARQARDTGMPMMRALWLHYPDDEAVRGLGDQYLWGRDMLIAPVYEPHAAERRVYLPAGKWYDFWANEQHLGGRTITRHINISKMPIYVRAGAIIPFDPVRQYTGQQVNEPTTIEIYTGANGEFTLYSDDGISLDYLDGKAAWTKMTWDDSARQFTIEPDTPEGTTSLPMNYRFRVELLPEGATREINYTDKKISIEFSNGDHD